MDSNARSQVMRYLCVVTDLRPELPTELRADWRQLIESTVGSAITRTELIQSVWSGYGQLLRVLFADEGKPSLVVKAVVPPDEQLHPRGWQSDIAHQRKLKSYRVEACWYERYASATRESVAMPVATLVHQASNGMLLVLEDLDAEYPRRLISANAQSCRAGLEWLARFHAMKLDTAGEGLWETGCYWHLQTRPDEWAAMPDGPLKTHAHAIDAALLDCEVTTLVHGDAKAANFCLSVDKCSVAAVDFQYIGRGCGMRDLVYYLGSCLSDQMLYKDADSLLDHYFKIFSTELQPSYERQRIRQIEQRWRELYAFAWADFQRFLLGWAPDHAKLNDYSAEQTLRALERLS